MQSPWHHAHVQSTAPQPLAGLSLTDCIPSVNMRLHSRSIMIALSYAIEDHAAGAGASTTLIATFQRLSLYTHQVPRYRQLAPRLAQVFVVGVADVTPPPVPNVTVVPIDPGWPLVHEWVVIGCGPSFQAGLFARDAEGFRMERRSRQFHARWTTDAEMVEASARAFLSALGRPMPRLTHDTRAAFVHARTLQREIAQRMRG